MPASQLNDPKAQAFADYAVVMRGLAFDEASATWCEWMAQRLAQ